MLIIEIATSEVRTIIAKSGKSFKLQTGFAKLQGSKYPVEFSFFPPVVDGVLIPYQPGNYQLSPLSFNVESGRLQINYPVLVRIPESGKSA